jgi:hypothetical protein
MKLKDITLTDPADLLMESTTRQSWRKSGRGEDSIYRHGTLMGDGSLFEAETVGEEESVLYSVFVGKIRRDNQGLEDQQIERQREWYEMANEFVSEFGEGRTPPDILDCMLGCKNHLGL